MLASHTLTRSNSLLIDAWGLDVGGRAAGTLELHSAKRGLLWVWVNKPDDLVQLRGVRELGRPDIPFYFYDVDSARDHLMSCTGVAFAGRCGLVALDLHAPVLH